MQGTVTELRGSPSEMGGTATQGSLDSVTTAATKGAGEEAAITTDGRKERSRWRQREIAGLPSTAWRHDLMARGPKQVGKVGARSLACRVGHGKP